MLDGVPESMLEIKPPDPIPLKKFTPNGNLVALYVYRAKPTDAGLVLPEGSSAGITQSPIGLVIACGPDCKWVKEGDTVIFGHVNPASALVLHQKSRYWMCLETQITGRVLPEYIEEHPELVKEGEGQC